jgi:hypothetical protein
MPYIEDLPAIMGRVKDAIAKSDLSPAWAEIMPIARAGFASNFADGGSHLGPWPPHAPATVRRYGPHPLLILSGKLYQAATSSGGAGHVEILDVREAAIAIDLAAVPYARAQNEGYPPGNLPARPYFVLGSFVTAEAAKILRQLVHTEIVGAM